MHAAEPADGAEPFTRLVPDEIARAYGILLETDGIPADEAAADLGGDSVIARLTSLGMAHVNTSSGRPVLIPATPSLALQGVLADTIARMNRLQKLLQAGIETILELHGLDCAVGGVPPHNTFKPFTDRGEIAKASTFLINSARRDWMAIDIAARDTKLTKHSYIQPPEEIRSDIRCRCLYDEKFTETEEGMRHIRDAAQAGEEARFLPELPMKMQLADTTSVLLPATFTGMGGAFLCHAEPLVAGMRQYFELLWDIAHPLSGPDPERDKHLDADHQIVLDLLARGHEHKQIAAETGFGKSTVDHYAQDICKTLGARNRLHAIALAEHRHWIDWTATIPAQRTTRRGKQRPASR